MTLPAKLGPYEILDCIGSGGMGEVYQARDSRLGRDVAIKVLPQTLSQDSAQLRRFEQEAKTLAALSHPNVLSIFDTGVHEGAAYLVSELLHGQTLRDALQKRALAQRTVVETALQIAQGLAAAHAKGIIHRDLKPENVFLTKDGRVKILDFGLAKLMDRKQKPEDRGQRTEESRQNDGTSGAITLVQTTEPGVVLGTVGYMSPEQVRGEEADHRSDIFAFGCILYEMLSGQRAFRSPTAVQTMNAILTEEPPDISDPNLRLSPALERLMRRCLEKEPEKRFQTVSDLAFALESLAGTTVSLPSSQAALLLQTSRPKLERAFWIAVSSVMFVFLVLSLVWARQRVERTTAPELSRELRFSINLATNAPLAFGDYHTGFESPLIAIAPDASEIAYVARIGETTQLYRRRLDSWTGHFIPDTQGAIHPFYSPDGQSLGFLTTEKVKKVSLTDEWVMEVCQARTPVRATWTDDDWIYVSIAEGLQLARVRSAGGPLESLPGLARMCQVLPDGSGVFIPTMDGSRHDYAEITLLDLRTFERKPLGVRGYDAYYVPTGQLIYCRDGALYTVGFDLKEHRAIGKEVRVESGVAMHSLFGYGQLNVARDGTLIYVPGNDLALGSVAVIDRNGKSEFISGVPEKVYNVFDLSPDDRLLAIQIGDMEDSISIFDLSSRQLRKLTTSGNCGWPRWKSPGADTVSFVRRGAGRSALMLQRLDSQSPHEELVSVALPDWVGNIDWSHDGKRLAFNTTEQPRTSIEVAWIDMQLRQTNRLERGLGGTFSPDGNWLAFASDASGNYEIWATCIADPPENRRPRQISTRGGMEPIWLPSGDLFWRWQKKWFVARVTTDPELRSEPPRLAFETDFIDTRGLSYDVSSDGQRLYVVKRTRPIIEHEIRVVRNWLTPLSSHSR